MNHRMRRIPCGFSKHKGLLDLPSLASRVSNRNANDNPAAKLGDGKETDDATNCPESQTNPALFAAPHSFSFRSEQELRLPQRIHARRARKFERARH
jgi:hypothetical protein